MKARESRIRVKVVRLGYFPFEINLNKIQRWKSKLFEVVGDITIQESIKTIKESEFYDDDYLVHQINKIKRTFNDQYEFLFVISNIKLKNDWYSRVLIQDIVIMSYKNIIDILEKSNIPSENAVLMLLYTYALLYKKNGQVPSTEEENFLHGDTRGCLFDLSSEEKEIVYSCISPIICEECRSKLSEIDNKLITRIQKKELHRIKRRLSFDIMNQIKKRPIISALFAIFLPISLSLATTMIAQRLPSFICWILILMPLAILLYLIICIIRSSK